MKRKYRIKVTLSLAIGLFLGLTTLIVIIVNYSFTSRSLRNMVYDQMSQVSANTLEKTRNFLGTPEILTRVISNFLVADISTNDDVRRIEKLLSDEIRSCPQVVAAYAADLKGNFLMVRREAGGRTRTRFTVRLNGSQACVAALKDAETLKAKVPGMNRYGADRARGAIRSMIAPCVKTMWRTRDGDGRILEEKEDAYDPFDPRLRPWYTKAVTAKRMAWTDVYSFYTGNHPGITITAPVKVGGRIEGVVGLDVELKDLQAFLGSMRIRRTGRVFIANGGGQIIAYPGRDGIETLSNGSPTGKNNAKVKDVAAADAIRVLGKIRNNGARGRAALNKGVIYEFTSLDAKYVARCMSLMNSIGKDWIITVIVPENELLEAARYNGIFTLLISAISALIAIGCGIVLSRKITDPLEKLSSDAERIREFYIDTGPEVSSIFLEIDRMAASFDKMKLGLRSFRKFVPAEIVRFLLRSGKEAILDGHNRHVSIFFSDIEGFTTISERMESQQLVEHLGELFEKLSDIIHRHEGTVDKYIGDAVMAFWNAPQDVAGHAVQSCHAALEIQESMAQLRESWRRRGVPELSIRIGIESGEAIVGNMGSATRMNYTVLGDSVNTASRLEGLNKFYGTRIIIGENTFALVKDTYAARRIDYVAVKGKTTGMNIYELLSERRPGDNPVDPFIRTYEEALDLYQNREWRSALALFEVADGLRGAKGDMASRQLMKRCRAYMSDPPPETWDGVFRFETK